MLHCTMYNKKKTATRQESIKTIENIEEITESPASGLLDQIRRYNMVNMVMFDAYICILKQYAA